MATIRRNFACDSDDFIRRGYTGWTKKKSDIKNYH